MLTAVLLQHSYLYLLHYIIVPARKQIHHWFFSGEKVSRTPVVLKMAIRFREKKWNQSSDIYFIENIPKTSKNAAHVLQCEFFLKASL